MEQPLFVFLFLVLVSSCWRSTVPEFCLGKPCPEFKLVVSEQYFEERQYVATDWISTRAEACTQLALLSAHLRLKSYCSLHADVKDATDTWPVLAVASEEKTTGELDLSWFIDPRETKPEITDPYIEVQHIPASTVYVREFSGTPSLQSIEENVATLRKALTDAKKRFDEQTYGTAVYGHLVEARYEIWIRAPYSD